MVLQDRKAKFFGYFLTAQLLGHVLVRGLSLIRQRGRDLVFLYWAFGFVTSIYADLLFAPALLRPSQWNLYDKAGHLRNNHGFFLLKYWVCWNNCTNGTRLRGSEVGHRKAS